MNAWFNWFFALTVKGILSQRPYSLSWHWALSIGVIFSRYLRSGNLFPVFFSCFILINIQLNVVSWCILIVWIVGFNGKFRFFCFKNAGISDVFRLIFWIKLSHLRFIMITIHNLNDIQSFLAVLWIFLSLLFFEAYFACFVVKKLIMVKLKVKESH